MTRKLSTRERYVAQATRKDDNSFSARVLDTFNGNQPIYVNTGFSDAYAALACAREYIANIGVPVVPCAPAPPPAVVHNVPRSTAIQRLTRRWNEQRELYPTFANDIPLALYIARNLSHVMQRDLLRAYDLAS